MSGMDAATQAVLLLAQALNQTAANIPAVLPIPVPTHAIASAGTCTLTNGGASTVVANAACTAACKIFLLATSGGAAATLVYVDVVSNGSFTIEHPGVAGPGCTFFYLIVT